MTMAHLLAMNMEVALIKTVPTDMENARNIQYHLLYSPQHWLTIRCVAGVSVVKN